MRPRIATVAEGARFARFVALLTLLAGASLPAAAGKPKPVSCTDPFPSFLFSRAATRSTGNRLYLASRDGCRQNAVAEPASSPRSYAHSLSAPDAQGRRVGVIVWTEELVGTVRDRLMRRDYVVDAGGILSLESPFVLLDASEAAWDHEARFFGVDLWGNANHSELYLSVQWVDLSAAACGPSGTCKDEARIYDLRASSLARVVVQPQDACGSTVSETDPGCYPVTEMRWGRNGNWLYYRDDLIGSDGRRWDASLRVPVNRSAWPLTFGAPQIVATGPSSGGPALRAIRPASSTDPDDRFATFDYYIEGSDSTAGRRTAVIDIEECVGQYQPYSVARTTVPPDLYLGCLETVAFPSWGRTSNPGGGDGWQSSDALLRSVLDARRFYIYRRYMSGPLTGLEEVLVTDGSGADTGE